MLTYEVIDQRNDRSAALIYDAARPFVLVQIGTKRCIVNRYATKEVANRAKRRCELRK